MHLGPLKSQLVDSGVKTATPRNVLTVVAFNVHHGEYRSTVARLIQLHPKILVLPECCKPATHGNGDVVWFGENPRKGVAVVARDGWRVEKAPEDRRVPNSVYPVTVRGPETFNLLAVWAMKRPTYMKAVLEGVKTYSAFLKSAPSIIVGDFNSHKRWDANDRKASHSVLEKYLREEFGLVSAFHQAAIRDGRTMETPTYYHYWRRTNPFHIDYCFFPESWVNRLGKVLISDFSSFANESDHRPLAVEFGPRLI